MNKTFGMQIYSREPNISLFNHNQLFPINSPFVKQLDSGCNINAYSNINGTENSCTFLLFIFLNFILFTFSTEENSFLISKLMQDVI